jgi:hypothetical protein
MNPKYIVRLRARPRIVCGVWWDRRRRRAVAAGPRRSADLIAAALPEGERVDNGRGRIRVEWSGCACIGWCRAIAALRRRPELEVIRVRAFGRLIG